MKRRAGFRVWGSAVAAITLLFACARSHRMTSADCAESDECARFGRCALKHDVESGRRCVIASDSHCRQSLACREEGKCWHVVTGLMTTDSALCMPRLPEDCRQSQACAAPRRHCELFPMHPEQYVIALDEVVLPPGDSVAERFEAIPRIAQQICAAAP